MENQTAVETMKEELNRIQTIMSECMTESGFVKNEHKYRYMILANKARAFKESIDWMESLYQPA